MGTRLIFLDLQQDGRTLQVVANFGAFKEPSIVSENSFQQLYHLAKRGDYICRAFIKINLISSNQL